MSVVLQFPVTLDNVSYLLCFSRFSGKSCDELSSDTTQEIRNERSSYTDTQLPQENRRQALDHNLNTRTVDRTGSHLPDDGGMSRTSGCDQEEEEEVDVLLFSPDRAPKPSECENALNNMEISPDEEEEDVNEIDVTGDEAE